MFGLMGVGLAGLGALSLTRSLRRTADGGAGIEDGGGIGCVAAMVSCDGDDAIVDEKWELNGGRGASLLRSGSTGANTGR